MIILDIEASGTEPALHSILSLGALSFEDPSNTFYEECRLWEGAHVDPDALRVNGFSEEAIRSSTLQSEQELAEAFFSWTQQFDEQTLAGQNPSFDRDFLKAAAKRAHISFPFASRTIDTHTLAYMHMVARGIEPPHKNHHSGLSLDEVLQYVGLAPEPRPHNALMGAKLHAESISRLLYGKKLLPEFEPNAIPWQQG